ncbi:hypothetical protein ACFYXS_13200 [Streptomyces sp. NPDC002574]|uniref:hypothetical protein n=1 Tax=Streptomyces sp. NPDC002574 TaxID=3364652 RepID=UPI00368C5F37
MKRTTTGYADRRWAGDARSAVGWTLGFLTLALALDAAAGTLDAARAGLWTGLAALVLAVLLPPRVTADEGTLSVHGLPRTRTVRTDALVAVRRHQGPGGHLLLYDAFGRRVEVDPRTLIANPLLWHLLEAGAHRSRELGVLRHGFEELAHLGERVDGPRALAVFRVSGLA